MKSKLRMIPKRIWILVIIILIILVLGELIVRKIYNNLLLPVASKGSAQTITIASGSSIRYISDLLAQDKIIQSSWAAQLYINAHGLSDKLQAGTYSLSPSEATPQIINEIVNGRVATKLVTILPGTNIFKLQSDLEKAGYSKSEVSSALNFNNYLSLPLMSFVPKGTTTLEGLLWPDSFQRNSNTPLSQIIIESLNEMDSHLTSSVQSEFASEGLTTYQGIILASIIDQEVSKPSDQIQVAQVFLSRLKAGMNLGSDVTAYYGSILSGQKPSLSFNSPYNTLLHTGLPPTPISTISASSLYAATHPANTNWLYFVTGDNGTTYFSNTLAQQQANTALYCHKLCSQAP